MDCFIVLETNSLPSAVLTATVDCFYDPDFCFYKATALYFHGDRFIHLNSKSPSLKAVLE
jgi:hypothetical protein